MTYFQKSGTRFTVTPKDAIDLHESLPVGTYTVKYDDRNDVYFLETVDGFKVSGKIYGDTKITANRILKTFDDRTTSTGVMLSGEKGSGKTLLAKVLSLDAQDMGYPTIIINQPWSGDTFNGFMQTIEQPIVVIFDEFEKVYDREGQERLLTLFDGVYPSKKLFVITCNDKYRVDEHMKNRPGRIYYRIDYTGLDTEFITEYCGDNLTNKNHIDSLCRLSIMFGEFNFDILKAMVEEMNRYGESPQDVMKVLNAKPEFSDNSSYSITLEVKGAVVTEDRLNDSVWRGNPLTGKIVIYYKNAAPAEDSDDFEDWEDSGFEVAKFAVSDLSKIDADTGRFHYVNAKGEKLSMSKVQAMVHDWNAF